MKVNKKPYLIRKETIIHQEWNPKFDQDAVCVCGHEYNRHFDSYEDMAAIGCKYCPCFRFSFSIKEWEKLNQYKYFKPIQEFIGEIEDPLYTVSVITLEEYEQKKIEDSPVLQYGFPTKDGMVCDFINVSIGGYREKIPFDHDGFVWYVFK